MTIGELIDFYLSVRAPANLLGFDSVFGEELEALKAAIQTEYGSQETWLAMPEEAELPEALAEKAQALVEKYRAWNQGGNGR